MKAVSRIFWGAVLLAAAGAVLAALQVVLHGISARDEPTAFETVLARRLRHLAIPRRARELTNPIPLTPEVLAEARAHFADHCALCHGNDGRGRTEIGQNLYPKAPDMWSHDTQDLSDGELFCIIENGVRLTGMPAWGHGTAEDTRETWKLVHFIRRLPKVTAEELEQMKALNPTSRREIEEELEAERFLSGEDRAEPPPHTH